MDNRRNFYRILRVQPDAPFEVIRQSYRSLMQKLRLHPDLGGEQWDASIINQAYAILRDPQKRVKYDAELLNRYNIETLTSGGVIKYAPEAQDQNQVSQNDGNQRNYYRLLHVQPDAEFEVIKASYRMLAGQSESKIQKRLLNEAFFVIGNARLRAQYDALLRSYTHAASVEKLISIKHLNKKLDSSALTPLSQQDENINFAAMSKGALCADYRSAIKHYCKFCKTPYSCQGLIEQEHFCIECSSPLSSIDDIFIHTPRRSLVRIQQSEPAHIYQYWPGEPMRVALEDLSPMGINFSTIQSLDINQIIKVEANHFKAVGEIAHCRKIKSSFRIGVRFLTVEFSSIKGNFLSTTA